MAKRNSHERIFTLTELLTVVTTEIKTLTAHPDLDPLERGRVVAQLTGVALQIRVRCQEKETQDATGRIWAEASRRTPAQGYEAGNTASAKRAADATSSAHTNGRA
jgi:hypothetical protein